MSITVFADVLLPNSVIAMGIEGQNARENSRVALDSGYQSINQVWASTLRRYTLGIVPMGLAAWQEIETLHEITAGGVYGFLMEDPKDHAVASGVVTDVSAGIYQLHKRILHAASSRYKDRKITRPRAAGLVVKISGTPTTAYTLDVTTGQLTIPAAPAAATVSWTGLFYVPVNFAEDAIDWTFLAGGSDDQRLLAGPSVLLQEVRE